MLRMCVARGLVYASRTNVSKGLTIPKDRSLVRHPMESYRRRSLHAQVAVQDEETARDVSEKVQKIADEILDLNLLEISDLSNILKEKLGLDQLPVGGVGMMPAMAAPVAGGGDAGAAASAEAAVEEKTSFNIKLEAFDKAAKIKVIKEVRAVTELGLKEAKDMVEKAPVIIKEGVAKAEAEEMKKQIEEVGATIVLE